jgi:hypothetical protein
MGNTCAFSSEYLLQQELNIQNFTCYAQSNALKKWKLHCKIKFHISEYNCSGSPKVHKEISHMENMPLDINISIFHPEVQIILL